VRVNHEPIYIAWTSLDIALVRTALLKEWDYLWADEQKGMQCISMYSIVSVVKRLWGRGVRVEVWGVVCFVCVCRGCCSLSVCLCA